MKKILAVIAVICAGALLMCACGGQKENPDKPSDSGKDTVTTENAGDVKADGDDYYFTYKGTDIHTHAEAADIIAALGEPKDKQESASCAFEENDIQYFYGSFYLTTGTLKGVDYITALWFADDTVETNEGLCIGDSKEKVEKIYGTDGFNGTNAYVNKKGDMELTIIIKDDAVSSIQYIALWD